MVYSSAICILFSLNLVICFDDVPYDDLIQDDFTPLDSVEYMGEMFPHKYLVPEPSKPTLNDLRLYMGALNRSLDYFFIRLNDTEVNDSLGLYFSGAILKSTIMKYNNKLSKPLVEDLKHMIRKAGVSLSHYIYRLRGGDFSDQEYRVSILFKEDNVLVHSLGDFYKLRLKKWILSKWKIHEYVKQLDDLSLPKEEYCRLVQSMDEYFLDIDESDECISRVAFLPEPLDMNTKQWCLLDDYCETRLLSSPSIAYALSHRLFNLALRHLVKRCYIQSEKIDEIHMEVLCSFMYREAVYIARRGFFSRDIFMEHIALCGMLGFEEFHRRNWFHKISSWVDHEGCLRENMNFEMNRTMYMTSQGDEEKAKRARERLAKLRRTNCQRHPMSLSIVVMALAVKHAVHYLSRVDLLSLCPVLQ